MTEVQWQANSNLKAKLLIFFLLKKKQKTQKHKTELTAHLEEKKFDRNLLLHLAI